MSGEVAQGLFLCFLGSLFQSQPTLALKFFSCWNLVGISLLASCDTGPHPFPVHTGKNGGQYLHPSQTFFQAKQSQFSHPLPLYHKVLSKHICVLPLNSLQFVNVSLVLGVTNWTQYCRCVSPMPKFSMK